jgi:hypothetical protein
MSREKIGIIIIMGCCLALLTMFLFQLPNNSSLDQPEAITSYGGTYSNNFIPIENISSSPINTTFYMVGAGGAGGQYPQVITK